MLKIKLKPNGKIHQRSFRIVVSPDRSKSNGKFIDDIGFYTPQTKTLQIDKVKMAQWIKNGAQLTEGVDKLLNPEKYPRIKKVKPAKEVKVKVQAAPVVEKIEKKVVEEVKTSAEGGSASGGEETNQNPSADVAASPLDKGDEIKEEVTEVKTEETK
jgi:small subunit ribosomal protein S16